MIKQNINILSFGPQDFLALIFYIIVAVSFSLKLRRFGVFYTRFFMLLALEHLLFTVFYWAYTITNVADAIGYYSRASSTHGAGWFTLFSAGTAFIDFMVYPLVELFKLNYLGCYFIFSLTALSGCYVLVRLIIEQAIKYQVYLDNKLFWFFMLPSFHFWTVAIGKDSLIFLFLSLMICGLVKRDARFVIGVIGAGLIRAHVVLLVFAGLGIGYVFLSKKVSIGQKIIMLLITGVGMYILLPMVMERLGMTEVSIDSVSDSMNRNLSYNQAGGGSVDMSNANFVVKVLSYLFRPFFFDARGAMALLSSMENIVWIYIVYRICRNLVYKIRNVDLVAPLFFAFLMVLIGLASVLNNLGIAVRQKMMFFPFLIVLLFISSWYEWMIAKMRHERMLARSN